MWSNVILDVSGKVLMDEINIGIGKLIKQIALPKVGGPHSVS